MSQKAEGFSWTFCRYPNTQTLHIVLYSTYIIFITFIYKTMCILHTRLYIQLTLHSKTLHKPAMLYISCTKTLCTTFSGLLLSIYCYSNLHDLYVISWSKHTNFLHIPIFLLPKMNLIYQTDPILTLNCVNLAK